MNAPTGTAALRAAIPRLLAAGIPAAAGDARALLAHALGLPPDRLTLHLADPLPEGAESRFEAAIAARLQHQPVAQIVGGRLFWGHWFKVTKDTLDPRPETETLVAEALRRPFSNLLDLGTGTGCILLSCLAGMPMARGLGIDASPAALAVAEENRRALGLARRADLRLSDWFAEVPGRYDLIVSNPPYLAKAEIAGLAADVRDWEPHQALTPGGDGLDAYRAIARGAPARLMAGGRLLMEIGPTQAGDVAALLAAQGLVRLRVLPDLDGRPRVVVAEKPGVAADRGGI